MQTAVILEQAFFAQRRIWASRALRRVPCDAIITRLARFQFHFGDPFCASGATSGLANFASSTGTFCLTSVN
jgi:hypothetical protein